MFNLIGFFFKDASEVEQECDYIKPLVKNETIKVDDKFLPLRDYHDLLVDTYDKQWMNISLKTLENALSEISEVIEEAGDKYYKITREKITNVLISRVQKIVENFPKSLPIPIDYPDEIKHLSLIHI